ncbi:MAG: helix repeat-containing protein [Verrucomicrobiales bacterium]|nr:helix repeat-containing protein [Verrucomicrobiales bacterium]
MNETRDSIVSGASLMWANTLAFLPKFGLFLVILIAGYFVAKGIGKLVDRVLERLGFDRLVERGGIKRALDKSNLDASDVMCKIVFYTLFLFVLQLAFGVFGANPISAILTSVIAFLPTLFVSLLIVVVAAAIAKGVKEILAVVFGGLSYGRALANVAGAAILVTGVFAALSHLQIAPAIVNGLFYALLAIVAGSAIIAIGGGGILPMRRQWERAITKVESEAPRLKAQTEGAGQRVEAKAEEWKQRAKSEVQASPAQAPAGFPEAPRYEPKERGRDRV